MKSRFTRVALLSSLVVASPMLTFAGGQPKVRMVGKSEAQNTADVTRAVQQGKGSGMTRNSPMLPANAGRIQAGAVRSNWTDPAFRK